MAFVDEAHIRVYAGRGGAGVARWLHFKGKDKGGPAGGDGGRGGDIILEGVRDLGVLATYRFTKEFRAQNGQSGDNNNKHGADGAPIILKVPTGTTARDAKTGMVWEILSEGERVVLYKGGGGGFGNAHFKSSTNQNPDKGTPGRPGEGGDIQITLKLIADAGLVGFPNAGKSSLLNAVTRANARVGAYPFTTLDPNLGDFHGFILADIPGLIEGASAGRGLGSKFLRHIERTKFLVHLVSSEQEDVCAAYTSIRNELALFGHDLDSKKEVVVLSKSDMVDETELASKRKQLEGCVVGGEVWVVSVLDDAQVADFGGKLSRLLETRHSS